MPNLFHPNKFSMFSFFNEVKTKAVNFNKHNTQIVIPEGTSLFHTDLDDDIIFLKIAKENDENDIYGAMKLNNIIIRNSSYYVVEKIATTEKYRKKGIATILYKFVIELNFNFMSDSVHTTFGSKDLWLKFPEYFPEKNMYILNIKTLYKRKFTTQNEHTIWGKQSDEDFDVLDRADKVYLVEEMYSSHTITKQQSDFFINNIGHLTDKSDVRLVLE